jgi:hypothetical protein
LQNAQRKLTTQIYTPKASQQKTSKREPTLPIAGRKRNTAKLERPARNPTISFLIFKAPESSKAPIPNQNKKEIPSWTENQAGSQRFLKVTHKPSGLSVPETIIAGKLPAARNSNSCGSQSNLGSN